MQYVYSLPSSASFTDKGLTGHVFGPLNQKDLEVYYIEVEKGFFGASAHHEWRRTRAR
jgi:hypothetical protein